MEFPPDPPRGFTVLPPHDGSCIIRYRTTGARSVGCFFTVWLSGWTAACVVGTWQALFAHADVQYLVLLFLIPFWAAEIFTIAYVFWFFFSVTTFAFTFEQLIGERSLFGYRRARIVQRSDVKLVKQVKDGGEGEDSFPSWGLVIVAKTNVKIVSRQPIEKSSWLGPIVAKWAGVPFEPYEVTQSTRYDSL